MFSSLRHRSHPACFINVVSITTIHTENSNWELIASGQTVGSGPKVQCSSSSFGFVASNVFFKLTTLHRITRTQRYTRVNEEDTVISDEAGKSISYKGFESVHVPGDRGMRSFYVAITKRFTADDGQPIPLLFSYPSEGNDAEGTKDYEIIDSTPELEVFEGKKETQVQVCCLFSSSSNWVEY